VSLIVAMILASFAANVDNVTVGMDYAIRGERIPFRAIAAVSVISALSSALTVQLGHWLVGKIPSEYAEWVAGILLGFVGIRISLAERKLIAQKVELLERKWWILTLGLSLNNLAMGLSGGFLGFQPALFGAILGAAGGTLLWIGNRSGIRLQCVRTCWMHRMSAAILILIGLVQILP
jgi:putative Mn2+ efflux pump MntP